MKTLTVLDQIRTRDLVNHLNCRKSQVLAYASSKTPRFALLFAGALESTDSILDSMYTKAQYRWAYPGRYIEDDDMQALGFSMRKAPKLEWEEFISHVHRLVDGDMPVCFFAPRGYFPHWRAFMDEQRTRVEEHFDYHSFMVAGISEDNSELLILDNTNSSATYQPYRLCLAMLRECYEADPDRWFVDCVTMSYAPAESNLDEVVQKFAERMSDHSDTYALYDRMLQCFEQECADYAEAYRAPYLNSLALLAGSRGMFASFLAETEINNSVKAAFRYLGSRLTSAFSLGNQFHAGTSPIDAAGFAFRLRELKELEVLAQQLLKGEAANGVLALRSTGA